MAKSIRSKIKRKHRAARRAEFAPTRDARQETRNVRMTAYVARTQARKLAADGKPITEELAHATAQADLLDVADDQMREKSARGHHYFLPPQSKLNATGPVLPDLSAVAPYRGRNTITKLSAQEENDAVTAMDDHVFGSAAALEARKAALARRELDLRDEAARRMLERRRAVEKAAEAPKGSFKNNAFVLRTTHSSK